MFDVKHDGRHKARYVAGGHLTDPPLDILYSGIVSLQSLWLVIFLAELNGLQLYAADVGNAYVEGRTKEKVCIYGGPEFRDLGLEGHLLAIVQALYGLKTSGADGTIVSLIPYARLDSHPAKQTLMCGCGRQMGSMNIFASTLTIS